MKNTIRSELRKALTNKLLYLSIGIGLVFFGMDVMENRATMGEFDEIIQSLLDADFRVRTAHTGYSLFYLWSGMLPATRGAVLFYTVWPVLAAMAYGWSYTEERRSGVYDQIACRTSGRTYYVAKYVAVFVSGALAVAVPVLVGLLANALVVPYDPIPSGWNLLGNKNFMASLFYESHWAFALVWVGMCGLFGGAAACLCFIVGTRLRYGVMVILTPYALYVGLDALINSLRTAGLVGTDLVLSPMQMVYATPGWANPEWFLFLVLAGLTALSFGLGYWQVVKHELA